jgi:hypothetical protein
MTMSVDTRLRQARPEDHVRWDTGLDLALRQVTSGARRRRVQRASVVVGTLAAVLAVGGVVATHGSGGAEPERLPVAPSPSAPSASTKYGSTPVDGEWHTAKVDRQDVLGALEAGGVPTATAEEFVTRLPQGQFRLRLLIAGGILQGFVNHDPVWVQHVTVSDGTFAMAPMQGGYGHWVFGWEVEGERLTLDLRRTTAIDFDGFPARVHALAFFGVAPFSRAP